MPNLYDLYQMDGLYVFYVQFNEFATKEYGLVGIDKNRNYLVANPILTFQYLQHVKYFISANNVESSLDFRFNDLALLTSILRRMFPNLLYSTVQCFIVPNHKTLGR